MKNFFNLGLFLVLLSDPLLAVKTKIAPDLSVPDYLIEIDLPFPYQKIGPEENFQYVTAGSYALYHPEAKFSLMVIGPLMPCFMVRFINQENGHVLVFHMTSSSSIDYMMEVAKDKLKIKDAKNVQVGIYSVGNQLEEQKIAKTIKGFTQAGRIREIRNAIIKGMNIPKDQVRGTISQHPEFSIGEYVLMGSGYLIINREGKLFCTDPLVEDIFDIKATLGEMDLAQRVQLFIEADNVLQSGLLQKAKKDAPKRSLFESPDICLMKRPSGEEKKD